MNNDMTVPGLVNGKAVTLLVDTGSSHSVLRGRPDVTPTISTQHGKLDTAYPGASIEILGKAKMTLQLGGHSFNWQPYIVKDAASPGYLGRDFLKSLNAQLDLQNQTLILIPEQTLTLMPEAVSDINSDDPENPHEPEKPENESEKHLDEEIDKEVNLGQITERMKQPEATAWNNQRKNEEKQLTEHITTAYPDVFADTINEITFRSLA